MLLADALGLPALNLAVGGVGPGFYTLFDRLIEAVNRGRFVILQCMAARHAGNSRFEPDGYVEFVIDRRVGDSIPSWAGWKRVIVEEPDKALRYVEETRQAWIDISQLLLSRIKVPVIFFYYSRRPAEYQLDFAANCAGLAECLSSRGMGHALVSRFTGKPLLDIEHSALGDEFVKLPHMSHNTYYPSPEMHEDACQALMPVARKVLNG
jgi:hypothetical protein